MMRCSRDRLPDTRETVRNHSRTEFRATKAGALYAIIVFVIGFILGTIRVLLVAPRLGETTAVIIEAPIMLAASWFLCRWCVDKLDVRRSVAARSLMGLVAFLVLMSAEVGLGAVLGDPAERSVSALDDLCHVPGHSGLATVEPCSWCSSDSATQLFRPAMFGKR